MKEEKLEGNKVTDIFWKRYVLFPLEHSLSNEAQIRNSKLLFSFQIYF